MNLSISWSRVPRTRTALWIPFQLGWSSQWTSALHYSLLQHHSSWWFLPGFPEERNLPPNSGKGESRCARGCQLPSDIEFVVSVEAVGTLCQQTVEWLPVDQQPTSIGAICLQKVPLNRVGRLEGPVRHLRSGWWENGVVTRATWPECGIRHGRPSNPLRQTALWVWTGRFRPKLVQIPPNQPNNLCSLQRADIRTVFILYGVPQGSVLGPILFILYEAGAINIAGKHGFAAHSYADDLQIYDHSPQSSCSSLVVRISNCVAEINEWMGSNRFKLNPSKTAHSYADDLQIWSGLDPLGGWSTARLVNSTSLGFPSSRPRTSVTSASWLTTICRCKHTSTMLHELASTICVNCESSGALSRQTRLTLSSELLCTADSTTAMGPSLVCFSTRSIGFNPFSVPQLALSLAYTSVPAFRSPCTTKYTGFPSQKGSSSNSVASFTSVYTRAHPGICLNTAYRYLRSLVDHTWDLRRPVTCLYQPPPPRQLALVDFIMLVQQLGTVSLLVWRTLI